MDEQEYTVYLPVTATVAVPVRATGKAAAIAKGRARLLVLEEGAVRGSGRTEEFLYAGMTEDTRPDFPAWAETGSGTATFRGMPVRCPVTARAEGDITGCGSTEVAGPDEEGLYDCCHCGIWFDPAREPEYRAVWTPAETAAYQVVPEGIARDRAHRR